MHVAFLHIEVFPRMRIAAADIAFRMLGLPQQLSHFPTAFLSPMNSHRGAPEPGRKHLVGVD